MTYRKVGLEDVATLKRIQHFQELGIPICDSYDHNESNGCSNPDCFKHPSGGKMPKPIMKSITFTKVNTTYLTDIGYERQHQKTHISATSIVIEDNKIQIGKLPPMEFIGSVKVDDGWP